MGRAFGILFLAAVAAGCATEEEPDVCRQAEDLIYECRGEEVDLGTCEGEVADEAARIADGGCAALDPGKSDVFTQLCQGPLRKLLPFCKPENYRCEPSAADLDPDTCNGSEHLCGLGYDEVVYATSHNAYNAATMGFTRPNQSKRMYVQLRDGIRALMLDVTDNGGQPFLCHQNCSLLGGQRLEEGLMEVRDFLDCYPNEVVTLLIEPHTDGRAIADAIARVGLDDMAYAHSGAYAWPTLREMIDQGTRLVVLAEKPGSGTPDWYHHMWDHAFDNEFSVRSASDFDCELERGDTSSSLFGLNHFVTFVGGDEFLSIAPNRYDSIMNHARECTDVFGQLPSYVAVDFHDIGDVIEVVGDLNAGLLGQ